MKFEVLQNAIVFRNAFEDLSGFIEEQKQKPLQDSGLSSANIDRYDTDIRESKQVSINHNNPVVEKVREISKFANENYFKINISHYAKENHFLQYDNGGKFEKHADTYYKTQIHNVGVCLNNNYDGGEFVLYNPEEQLPKETGNIYTFPSVRFHEVKKIIKSNASFFFDL